MKQHNAPPRRTSVLQSWRRTAAGRDMPHSAKPTQILVVRGHRTIRASLWRMMLSSKPPHFGQRSAPLAVDIEGLTLNATLKELVAKIQNQ